MIYERAIVDNCGSISIGILYDGEIIRDKQIGSEIENLIN